MGNLEKAGIGVVVLLLGVILVVAFLGDPGDPNGAAPPGQPDGRSSSDSAESPKKPSRTPEIGAALVRGRSVEEAPHDVTYSTRTIGEIDNSSRGRKSSEGSEVPPPPDGGASKTTLPSNPLPSKNESPAAVTRLLQPAAGEAPKSTPPAPIPGYPKEVKLGDGENIWKVVTREYPASIVNLMLKQVLKVNGIKDPKKLKAGATVKLPPPATDPAGTRTPTGVAPDPDAGAQARKPAGPPAASAKAPAKPAPADFLPFDPEAGRPPLTAPASVKPGSGTVVIVRRGESLLQIARREMGSAKYVKEIADLNRIRDVNNVLAGTKLRLPK